MSQSFNDLLKCRRPWPPQSTTNRGWSSTPTTELRGPAFGDFEGQSPTKLTKQLKNMMTGITQGYTKNLELRGIGYQGKIIELGQGFARAQGARSPIASHSSAAGQNWGQLENKIDEIAGSAEGRLTCPTEPAPQCPSGAAKKKFLVLNLG